MDPAAERTRAGKEIRPVADSLNPSFDPAVIETGSVWPRNALRGLPIYKVDMRVSKTIGRPGALQVTMLGEVFNLFNRKNYGSYTTQLDSVNFGLPVASSGNAFVPRSGQLGFRVEF